MAALTGNIQWRPTIVPIFSYYENGNGGSAVLLQVNKSTMLERYYRIRVVRVQVQRNHYHSFHISLSLHLDGRVFPFKKTTVY